LPDDDFYSQLVLEMGLNRIRANVEWCDRSIKRIHARQQKRSSQSEARIVRK
jgi:hypothetical protein